MGDKSKIEWTEATWNPITGCTKISPGCANCYIERTPPFRTKGRRFVRGHIPLQFHDDRLDQPLRWKRPRRIFVNSLSDLFHNDVPDAFIAQVFDVMARAPQHVFQVLTKRPERMRALAPQTALPNVWLGVSVENQHWADVRIPVLLNTPAAVRWVSYEPALGPVNFVPYLDWPHAMLQWIVVGGESGPGARQFDVTWARQTLWQCVRRGVPVFIKQLGSHPTGPTDDDRAQLLIQAMLAPRDIKGGNWDWWPEDIRVRQYPSI